MAVFIGSPLLQSLAAALYKPLRMRALRYRLCSTAGGRSTKVANHLLPKGQNFKFLENVADCWLACIDFQTDC